MLGDWGEGGGDPARGAAGEAGDSKFAFGLSFGEERGLGVELGANGGGGGAGGWYVGGGIGCEVEAAVPELAESDA